MPRDPFDQLAVVSKKLHSLFEEFTSFGQLFQARLAGLGQVEDLEVADTGNALEIKARLAGLDPKNLEVRVEEDAVYLQGHYSTETRQERKTGVITQYQSGAFFRTIPLAELVNPDQAKAKFDAGLLEITLPKSGKARSKSVLLKIDGK